MLPTWILEAEAPPPGGPASRTSAASEAPGKQARGPGGAQRPPADPDTELSAEALLDPLSLPFGGLDETLLDHYALPSPPVLDLPPRIYQREALHNWLRAGGRGVVVLPTGAGKTVLAFMAIEQAPVRTLVVVPTIELLRQWREGLTTRAGIPEDLVGVVGGGERTLRPVTVMTYDSAAMPHRDLSSFGLLIVDEVHHQPAPTYRTIAQKMAAPWRLGLSATPERQDGGHLDLHDLIGPEVYRKLPAELARSGHIADYKEKRILVDLSPEERYRYDALMGEYRWFIATQRARLLRGGIGRGMGNFFEALIHQSAHDPAARRALQAHHQARLIAMNAEGKLTQVEQLLRTHHREKVIVFCEYTSMVGTLSQKLALPAITYRTDPYERREILSRFRTGRFTKLVTGRVLNEGVDVPDANVAIVVSGSSATREYIQRLGRVLRPKPKGKEAHLYELISRKTTEGRSARARRPADAPIPALAA